MKFGVAIFFTDYSIKPTVLARALEDRGFDSLGVPSIPIFQFRGCPSGRNKANCRRSTTMSWIRS